MFEGKCVYIDTIPSVADFLVYIVEGRYISINERKWNMDVDGNDDGDDVGKTMCLLLLGE